MSPSGVDVLAKLRALSPARRLTWTEACSIAEHQAAALLVLGQVTTPPVSMRLVTGLPAVDVEVRDGWPTSGMSVYDGQRWHVVLRAGEPPQRQRFTLGHELKHILDDPVIDRLHAHIEDERKQSWAERLCNHFAACLLMPRPWLKHDYYGGLQDVGELAARYDVSEEAMTTRLRALGLTT